MTTETLHYYYLLEDDNLVEAYAEEQTDHEGQFLGASKNPNHKMAMTMALRNNGYWGRGFKFNLRD